MGCRTNGPVSVCLQSFKFMQATSTQNVQSLNPLFTMAEEGDEKNRRKGERMKKNLGDLMIGHTVRNVQDLEANMTNCTLELFDTCKWSIPPLMVACVLGYKDIVKFLLEKGANPNEKCTEERNTPLHYTCMLREYIEESDSRAEWYFTYEERYCYQERGDHQTSL